MEHITTITIPAVDVGIVDDDDLAAIKQKYVVKAKEKKLAEEQKALAESIKAKKDEVAKLETQLQIITGV